MSLTGSIRIGAGSLSAMQLGLQTIGNNIANAGTDGYIREEVIYKPALPQKKGDLVLGLGVQVDGIILKTDKFLAERLRRAESALRSSETQQSVYEQIETLFDGLGERDIGSSLTDFFGSVHDVLNQPDDSASRTLAILQGEKLAKDILRLDEQLNKFHRDIDQEIVNLNDGVNRFIKQVADLNVKIVGLEGGGQIRSDALNLRDERELALKKLAELIEIRTIEQDDGSVSVFANGEYLVTEGVYRDVKTHSAPGPTGLRESELRIAETESPLNSSSGRLAGYVISRDEVVGELISQLDSFAKTLIFEINKVHASGQGLTGHQQLLSEFAVENTTNPLDQELVTHIPLNGSFQVQVYNEHSESIETTDILVELNGLDSDTSMDELASMLDGIDGLYASATNGRLAIGTESPSIRFAFANDTSGVLAALGLNTFFTGTSAGDIGINQMLMDDPGKLATSRGGIGRDTENAQQLAQLLDTPIEDLGESTLAKLNDEILTGVTQNSALTHSVTLGFRTFYEMLESEHLELTGVNIDEEAVKMITLQRSFQASAKLITTVTEILEGLMNL